LISTAVQFITATSSRRHRLGGGRAAWRSASKKRTVYAFSLVVG